MASDFAAAELASVVARLTRMGRITQSEARATFTLFDTWRSRSDDDAETSPADIRLATEIVRRMDFNIRAPDAINLAIALRMDASIATFDRRMADSARALGIAVAAI